jgi:hypothetical protein
MAGSWTSRDWLAAAGALSCRAAGQTPTGKVRIDFIGVGDRGTGLLQHILFHPEVDVPLICDVNEVNLRRAQDIVEKAGRKDSPRTSGLPAHVRPRRHPRRPDRHSAGVAVSNVGGRDVGRNNSPHARFRPASRSRSAAISFASSERPGAVT